MTENIWYVASFTQDILLWKPKLLEILRLWLVHELFMMAAYEKNVIVFGQEFLTYSYNKDIYDPVITRKSSCVNARGIPPARGRKMLTPPRWLTPPIARLTWLPPTGWTWPSPPSADWPDTPPAGPDPPHVSWLTWPPPPVSWLTWPPPCGQTNKVKLLPSRRTTYAGGN